MKKLYWASRLDERKWGGEVGVGNQLLDRPAIRFFECVTASVVHFRWDDSASIDSSRVHLESFGFFLFQVISISMFYQTLAAKSVIFFTRSLQAASSGSFVSILPISPSRKLRSDSRPNPTKKLRPLRPRLCLKRPIYVIQKLYPAISCRHANTWHMWNSAISPASMIPSIYSIYFWMVGRETMPV